MPNKSMIRSDDVHKGNAPPACPSLFKCANCWTNIKDTSLPCPVCGLALFVKARSRPFRFTLFQFLVVVALVAVYFACRNIVAALAYDPIWMQSSHDRRINAIGLACIAGLSLSVVCSWKLGRPRGVLLVLLAVAIWLGCSIWMHMIHEII